MFRADDTIVAVSSAAGPAGRSIVRLSGPEAIALAAGVFEPPRSVDELPGFRALTGAVAPKAPVALTAPARLYLFRGPRSYTRQDVVELHVPGAVVADVVRAALLSAGARQAEPGEFTARAFFSGRLDLSSAEAVADIVDAEADAHLRSAVGMLDGALARLCRPAAEALAEALATAEASIDFADENLELCPPGELAGKIAAVGGELNAALGGAGSWQPASAEPKVAIAGAPNAGKSSLLNALSGVDRAIVSALAGTTRDVLSAPAKLPGGAEVMLLDAAGLAASTDPLVRDATNAARDAVAAAEVVLFVVDAALDDHRPDLSLFEEVAGLNRRAPVMVLANKIDLPADVEARVGRLRRGFRREVLPVSAATGDGLERLRRALAGALDGLSAPQPGRLLLHERQRRGIADAAAAARRAVDLLASAGQIADVAELLAVELRAGLHCLRELTGEVFTEDVLSAIFARFCVGK